jgi:probable F420-dependent oxidoreductase
MSTPFAVWDCWQNGTRLDVKGAHYNLSLLVPLFNAGPIDHPQIPIHLAAVNRVMCSVAGEVADGIRPHPVCTPSYIEHVMLPAVRAGAARSGRSLADFRVCMKPLVAAAPDEEQLIPKVRDARARIAFYASTPGYAAAFDHLGLGDLARDAAVYSRQQKWEELPKMISDDVLHQFAVVGTYDQIGRKLLNRFGRLITDVEFSIAVRDEQDLAALTALARMIQGNDDTVARATIAGTAA